MISVDIYFSAQKNIVQVTS